MQRKPTLDKQLDKIVQMVIVNKSGWNERLGECNTNVAQISNFDKCRAYVPSTICEKSSSNDRLDKTSSNGHFVEWRFFCWSLHPAA